MSEPTVTFGSAEGFGTISGWAAQNNDSNVLADRAVALNTSGEEANSTTHNDRTEVSATYLGQDATTAPTPTATLGALVGSYICTSIVLSTSSDTYPQMVLTGHNHTDNAHADTLHQAAHGVTLTYGFGVTDFLGGTAGSNACAVSSTCTISCEHRDEMGATGDHCVGQNYHGTIEATVEWVGVPTTAIGAGWDTTSTVTRTDNQGFLRTTATGIKKLVLS